MAEEDVPKEIAAATAQLFTWAEEFYLEERGQYKASGSTVLLPAMTIVKSMT